jgi:hypothetical protein
MPRAALPHALCVVAAVACGTSARNPLGDGTSKPGADAGDLLGDGGVRPGADGGGGVCPDVDILFVIDNSGSMADKQQRLANSFPGFAKAIQARMPAATSVQVGVVSTSAYYGKYPTFSKPIECLVTATDGPQSTNAACLDEKGPHYLDGLAPGFATSFQCVAKLGSGGDDDEKPMKALLGAADPANAAPGKCNAGFARKDALLVVVVITDEDDARDPACQDAFPPAGTSCGSGGDPDAWYAKLVSFKGGHPENVLVLSLLSRSNTQTNPGYCANGNTTRVLAFTNRFAKNGLVGDVCDASYDAFFTKALPVFDQACAGYVHLK